MGVPAILHLHTVPDCDREIRRILESAAFVLRDGSGAECHTRSVAQSKNSSVAGEFLHGLQGFGDMAFGCKLRTENQANHAVFVDHVGGPAR